jgi:hypothetical protein
LTPASVISASGKIAIPRKLPWLIDSSSNYANIDCTGASAASTIGPVTANDDRISTVTAAGTTTDATGKAAVLASAAGVIDVATSQAATGSLAYGAWPPKQNVYSWRLKHTYRVTIAHSAMNLLGSALEFYCYGEDDMGKRVLNITPLSPEAAGTSLTFLVQVETDGAKSTLMDFALFSDTVAAIDAVTIEALDFLLIGKPKVDLVDASDVDYIQDGVRVSLSASKRWVDLFGTIDEDPDADPNYSIDAVWNWYCSVLPSGMNGIIGALIDYDVATFGGGVSDPTLNKKYTDLALTNGILDMMRFHFFINSSGPFAGMSSSNIAQAVEYFTRDLEVVRDSFDCDHSLLRFLVQDNAATQSYLNSF